MEAENEPLMMDQKKPSLKEEDIDDGEAKDLSDLSLEMYDGCCNKN